MGDRRLTGVHEGDDPEHFRPSARGLLHLRDIGLLIPAYAVPGIASFVSVPVLFAVLGASEYGRWALLYGIAAGVPQVTTSWLEARLLRFGHRAGRRSDSWRPVVAVTGSIVFSALLAILFIPGATWLEIVAVAAFTTMVGLYVLLIARLQSALAFAAVSAAAMTRSVLGAVLGIAAALVSGRAAIAILGLALGYAAGELMGRRVAVGRGSDGPITSAGATIEPNAAIESGTATGEGGASDTVEPPLERATYGVASAAAAIASYALSVGDRFLLGASRPLAELGTYAATYSMVDLVGRFIPSVVLGAMRPRLFRAWDQGSRTELGSAAIILAAILGWMVVVMASLLIAAAEMTERLPVDLVLAGPIAFGFACFMAANTLGLAYSAATRQPRLAAHLGIAAVVNIGLNLVLIPPFGAEGAAATTAGSYLLLLVLNGSSLGDSARIGAAVIAVAASALAAIGCLVLAGAIASPPLIGVSLAILALGAPFVLRCGRTLRELG